MEFEDEKEESILEENNDIIEKLKGCFANTDDRNTKAIALVCLY